MLRERKASDSSQSIPIRWEKTLSRYLSRASDIFKKTSQVTTSIACSNLKRMGKTLSDSCVPKVKMFNFELLVPSKVQLQKSRTVFQSRMISYATLRQSSRIEKQYANMLEEYVVASFRSNYSSECY